MGLWLLDEPLIVLQSAQHHLCVMRKDLDLVSDVLVADALPKLGICRLRIWRSEKVSLPLKTLRATRRTAVDSLSCSPQLRAKISSPDKLQHTMLEWKKNLFILKCLHPLQKLPMRWYAHHIAESLAWASAPLPPICMCIAPRCLPWVLKTQEEEKTCL